MDFQDVYIKLTKLFGRFDILCKEEPKVSEFFIDSLKILKWDLKPKEIIIFSRFAAIIAFIFFLVLTLIGALVGVNPIYFILSMLAFPFLLLHVISEHPKNVAKMKILHALGEAPRTLVYLIIPLKQNPNLEEAIRFAATRGEGDIAKDLQDALWKSWSGKTGSVKEELPKIGLKWGKYSPDFKRALYLVRSSLAEKFEERRLETLDRSLSAALEGIVSKTRQYVSELFIPTLIIFSFGAVLPLMFVSLLPIMSFFGLSFTSPLEISILLGATLVLILVYSNKIIMQRPPTFSQPSVPELESFPKRGEIEIFSKRVPAWIFCTSLAILVGFPGIIFLFTQNPIIYIPPGTILGGILSNINTLTLVWGVGIAISVYAFGFANPRKKVRDEIKKIDEEILDGTYQIANRMAENRPPEDALEFSAEVLPDTEISKIFNDTAKLIRRRNVTLEQAFFNEKFGTLKNVFSDNVKSIMQFFVTSAKKGVKAASEILFTISNHLSDLIKTEKDLNEMIKKNISMMRATVVFFAPMICGIIVTMHQIIQDAMLSAQQQLGSLGYQPGFLSQFLFIRAPTISPELLQLIIGIYMLILTVILVRYIVLIENGPDEVNTKLEIAKTLPLSLGVFTIVSILSRTILGGGI